MAENQIQKDPLKLYIQDIHRSTLVPGQKYIYEMFAMQFKNIHIQGVITEMYFTQGSHSNFEVSDPTGTVMVTFNTAKSNRNIETSMLTDICAKLSKYPAVNPKPTLEFLKYSILDKTCGIKYKLGSHVSVIGDIYVDDIRDVRNVSAFDVTVCSVESDIVWLEELNYLYDKFYLWAKT